MSASLPILFQPPYSSPALLSASLASLLSTLSAHCSASWASTAITQAIPSAVARLHRPVWPGLVRRRLCSSGGGSRIRGASTSKHTPHTLLPSLAATSAAILALPWRRSRQGAFRRLWVLVWGVLSAEAAAGGASRPMAAPRGPCSVVASVRGGPNQRIHKLSVECFVRDWAHSVHSPRRRHQRRPLTIYECKTRFSIFGCECDMHSTSLFHVVLTR